MIRIFIDRKEQFDRTAIYIIDQDERTDRKSICQPVTLTFKPIEEGVLPEPTLVITESKGIAHQFLSALSEALISSGFKDKSISQEGEIKRMEVHISDLRSMAFKALDAIILKNTTSDR